MQSRLWKWRDKFNILLHVLAWAGFLSLPVIFISNSNIGNAEILRHWEFWFFGACFILLYYLNSFLWTPYIIRKKQYSLYLASIILVGIAFALWLKPFEKLMRLDGPPPQGIAAGKPMPPPGDPLPGEPAPRSDVSSPGDISPRNDRQGPSGRLDIASLYIVLLVILLGTLLRIVQHWLRSQQKIQQVQHEWTKSELAFLKAQVHPHFLFNTLNNIYSLALTDDPATAPSIHKLSQLMRYYMDERAEGQIGLQDEIQAIQDFISLQKLRIGPNAALTERYEGLDTTKKIFPFILLPFVENAFKHGLHTSEPCCLDFYIQVTDDYCKLEVKNSISTGMPQQPGSGTGLKNTKKLLDHLYPDQYKLDIEQDGTEFFIRLMLYI